jgi:hypothetical protein
MSSVLKEAVPEFATGNIQIKQGDYFKSTYTSIDPSITALIHA